MAGHGGGAAALGLGGMPGISAATAGIPAPSMLGELAQAIGQYPEQQRKAQAQEIELKQQQAQLDKTQQDQAMSQMSILARMARANQAWSSDPQFAAKMTQLSKAANIPLPTDPTTGAINLDAIPGSGGMMDMTPTERQAFMQSPESVRRSVWPGEPETAYKMPMYFAPKEMDQIQREFGQTMTEAMKTGDLSGVKAFLAANGPSLDQLEAAGRFSRADLAAMLDDPQFQQHFAPLVQARIADYESLGLSRATRDKVETQMLPQNIKNIQSMITRRGAETQQGEEKVGILRGNLAVQQQNAVSNAVKATAAADDASTKANDYELQLAKYQSAPNALEKAKLDIKLKAASTSLGSANKTYSDIVHQVDTLVSSAKAGTPVADIIGDPNTAGTLANQMKMAKGKIDAAQSTVDSMKGAAQQMQSNHYSAASGTRTTIKDDAPPNRIEKPSKSGRPMYSDDGGKTWYYQQ